MVRCLHELSYWTFVAGGRFEFTKIDTFKNSAPPHEHGAARIVASPSNTINFDHHPGVCQFFVDDGASHAVLLQEARLQLGRSKYVHTRSLQEPLDKSHMSDVITVNIPGHSLVHVHDVHPIKLKISQVCAAKCHFSTPTSFLQHVQITFFSKTVELQILLNTDCCTL